jgi:hypothetical protein
MSFNTTSDGSPTPRKGATRLSRAAGDLKIDTSPELLDQAVGRYNQNHYPYAFHRAFGSPLTANMQGPKRPLGASTLGKEHVLIPRQHPFDGYKVSDDPLRASLNLSSFSPTATTTSLSIPPSLQFKSNAHSLPFQKPKLVGHDEASVMDSLLQRITGHSSPPDQYNSSGSSVPITPATDEFASTPPSSMDNSVLLVDAFELQKLKTELEEARNEVNRMNQEMHSHQVARSTMDHLSQSSEADYGYTGDVTEQTLTQLQNKFNASTRTNIGWGTEPVRPAYNSNNSFGSGSYQAQPRPPVSQPSYRRNEYLNEPTHFPVTQSFRSSGVSGGLMNGMNGMSNSFSGMGNNMSNPPSRPGSAFDPMFNQYAMPPSMLASGYPAPVGVIGSRLSPDANEFNVANGMGPSPWNSQVSHQ